MKTSDSNHTVICFGEVLWDILDTGPLPGGAPMNVAYHLKKLGISSTLITRVGDDDYGKDLVSMLTANQIALKYEVDPHYPTGLVYAKVGDGHEVNYDIVYPSAWDFITLNPGYTEAVSRTDYFVFGSLASRSEVSGNTLYQLIEAAGRTVMDINLRAPHYERKNLENLLQKTDLLKMNHHELELVTNWFGQSGDPVNRMQFIQDYYNIPQIIVTRGAEGALLNDHGKIYTHQGYRVEVQDTIGSGDSFLAGFLARTLKGASPEEALDFAAGIGAFIATRAGGCPQYMAKDVDAMLHRLKHKEN